MEGGRGRRGWGLGGEGGWELMRVWGREEAGVLMTVVEGRGRGGSGGLYIRRWFGWWRGVRKE